MSRYIHSGDSINEEEPGRYKQQDSHCLENGAGEEKDTEIEGVGLSAEPGSMMSAGSGEAPGSGDAEISAEPGTADADAEDSAAGEDLSGSKQEGEPEGDREDGARDFGDGASKSSSSDITADAPLTQEASDRALADESTETENSESEGTESESTEAGSTDADTEADRRITKDGILLTEGEETEAEDGQPDSDPASRSQSGDMEAAGELGAEEQAGEDSPGQGWAQIRQDAQGNNFSGEDALTEEAAPIGGENSGAGEDEVEEAQDAVFGASGKRSGAEADSGKGKKKKPKDKKARIQEKRDKELSNSLEESIRYWNGDDRVPESLDRSRGVLTEVIGLDNSFDVVFREMSFAGTRAGLLFMSGFAKDFVMDEILKRLTYLTPSDMTTDAVAAFMIDYIPHIQVEKTDRFSEAVNKTMMGMSALFVDGERQVIVMDTRSYPARSPDEPSIERVVRGSRDGFTETLLSNVALVRRRLRDPGLTFKLHQVGRRTNTDVAIAYIDDIVDKSQVKAVSEKIAAINIDGIPLADKQLEEAIVGKNWNPYPMVRYSERPDVVASHLMEGRVVVFVDTSPSVMVIPTTFFDLCQHAEENRQTPMVGSYLRWVRFIGILCSIFLLPLWMLFVMHPEFKPASLEFLGPQETAKIPLLAQFLMIELGVDLLRMAAVHTPTPLGSAMGLIAAILIGDIAVKTGLFVNEVILYMALATIGMFATPSYELGLANRIVRLLLLMATGFFHVPGFVIGSTLLIVLLTLNRSYNSSYLWPFIPFNAKALGAILVRREVMASKTRPSSNKTRDNTRIGPPNIQNNES